MFITIIERIKRVILLEKNKTVTFKRFKPVKKHVTLSHKRVGTLKKCHIF